MQTETKLSDLQQLSELNRQFIRNFVNSDASSHSEIIHEDFVCIDNDGSILNREDYLSTWADGYPNSGYSDFTMGEEHIRLYNDIALVRSKTTSTKVVDGKKVFGHTIYTDIYKKENDNWRCIQAQITPVTYQ